MELNQALTEELVAILKDLGATEIERYYILAFIFTEEEQMELLEYLKETREQNMVKVMEKSIQIVWG